MSKKRKYDSLKYLSLLTQMGLSLVTPVLLCVWLGSFLANRFGLSQTGRFLLLLFGVGGGVSNLISFFRYAYREAKESEEREGE